MADEKKERTPHTRLVAGAESAAAHTLPSYRRFLIKTLKGSHPYAIYERVRAVFTPTLWVARALRIAHRAFLIVETSAFLLFAAAFLLVLLPVLLLLALAFYYATARERRCMNRRLLPLITGRRVLVFFGERAAVSLPSEGYTVLLVTDGLPMTPTAVARQTEDGTILVREHYFFYLRRTLLSRAARVALVF